VLVPQRSVAARLLPSAAISPRPPLLALLEERPGGADPPGPRR
jgi:hypothetical protein